MLIFGEKSAKNYSIFRRFWAKIDHSTLTYRIIVQDGINVQVGKSHKINKRAGWNKAVQVGIFHFLLMQNKVLAQNYPKLINVQDGIRACRLEFCKKLIRFAARLFDRLK